MNSYINYLAQKASKADLGNYSDLYYRILFITLTDLEKPYNSLDSTFVERNKNISMSVQP